MRVVVSSESDDCLDSKVSAHFGRCLYYTLVDVEDGEVKNAAAITNPYYTQHVPGAVPQFIRQQGADVMIAGGMGARAADMFAWLGIEVVTGAVGTVGQALQGYLGGALSGYTACTEHGV